MIVKYTVNGSTYSHAQNEVEFTIVRTPIRGEQGFRTGVKEAWQLRGELLGDTQAAVTTAIDALKAAYAQDGGNIGVYLDDGTTLTSHYINSADTTSGVMITQEPSFPDGKGAQYSTFRTYTIALEAEYNEEDLDDSDQFPEDTLVWTESVSIIGSGGPRNVVIPIQQGRPRIQTVYPATPVRCTQSGNAVGRSGYPAVPPPLFPAWEDSESRQISRDSPKREGPIGAPRFTEWPINWSYSFTSPAPLAGRPRLGPR